MTELLKIWILQIRFDTITVSSLSFIFLTVPRYGGKRLECKLSSASVHCEALAPLYYFVEAGALRAAVAIAGTWCWRLNTAQGTEWVTLQIHVGKQGQTLGLV